MAGRREPGGSVDFAMELPRCPVTRLLLDLPKNMNPSAQGVAVSRVGSAGNMVRWRLEAGGKNCFVLRIDPAEGLDVQRSVTSLRQATTYHVSPSGVDISAQLTLDAGNVPVGRLALEMDPGVQLVSAHCGENSLRWSTVPPVGAGKVPWTLLEFAEPIRAARRIVRVAAMAPVEIGRVWRLPGIRPQGVFWQDGDVTLQILSPLVMEHVAATGARQTRTGPPSSRTAESLEFQCFAADARIDLVVGRSKERLELDSATVVYLTGAEMSGRMTTLVRIGKGEQFEVAAAVKPFWVIELGGDSSRERSG